MTIIGITGTLGAGKGTVVEYLKQKGFQHYSARAFLFEEVDRRGMPRDRDSLNEVGEDLRAKHGAAYVVESLYDRAAGSGENAIIESIRTTGEVDALKAKGGILIGVDANPKTRYERVVKRGSETDQISFEKFIADEEREAKGDDPSRMNIKSCMRRANYAVKNDGSIHDLYRQLDEVLGKVG